ncbi:MAG: N-acetylglucosamine kinase [Cytophagales bacterium]|nr:N-acetylglucosamine kinase [Cytophagales bacterium]
MQVIADGGASKTVWRVYQKGQRLAEIKTKGLNPNVNSPQEIRQVLTELTPICQGIHHVHFYGSGCVGAGKELMETCLSELFSQASVFVSSDLIGAARGLLGRQKGYVGILGTGSNVCFYDGETIAKKKGGLGYILGDEGSGLSLGKSLICAYLNDELTADIQRLFQESFSLTHKELIQKVYQARFPNHYIAGFSPFLKQNIEHQSVQKLVLKNFRRFFELHFSDSNFFEAGRPVHFSGSVSYYFSDQLKQAAQEYGIETGKIVRSPVDGLEEYHGFLESVKQ